MITYINIDMKSSACIITDLSYPPNVCFVLEDLSPQLPSLYLYNVNYSPIESYISQNWFNRVSGSEIEDSCWSILIDFMNKTSIDSTLLGVDTWVDILIVIISIISTLLVDWAERSFLLCYFLNSLSESYFYS